jgi:hypothetical protein
LQEAGQRRQTFDLAPALETNAFAHLRRYVPKDLVNTSRTRIGARPGGAREG